MKLKKTLKKIAKNALKLYLAAYLVVSAHVGFDFVKYNLPRIKQGQTVQYLEFHKYKTNINGKEKYLVLVGENHNYNQTEYKIAKKLVDEHEHFADEFNSESIKAFSLRNSLYGTAVAIPIGIALFYNHLGNGRWYDSIGDIAEKRGYKTHALENPNDGFDDLSFREKARLLGESIFSGLVAPLCYYYAKNEKPYDAKTFLANFRYKDSLIDKRDKVMANEIINLLNKDEIDELLAAAGRAHLEGITEHLSKQIKLEKIVSEK